MAASHSVDAPYHPTQSLSTHIRSSSTHNPSNPHNISPAHVLDIEPHASIVDRIASPLAVQPRTLGTWTELLKTYSAPEEQHPHACFALWKVHELAIWKAEEVPHLQCIVATILVPGFHSEKNPHTDSAAYTTSIPTPAPGAQASQPPLSNSTSTSTSTDSEALYDEEKRLYIRIECSPSLDGLDSPFASTFRFLTSSDWGYSMKGYHHIHTVRWGLLGTSCPSFPMLAMAADSTAYPHEEGGNTHPALHYSFPDILSSLLEAQFPDFTPVESTCPNCSEDSISRTSVHRNPGQYTIDGHVEAYKRSTWLSNHQDVWDAVSLRWRDTLTLHLPFFEEEAKRQRDASASTTAVTHSSLLPEMPWHQPQKRQAWSEVARKCTEAVQGLYLRSRRLVIEEMKEDHQLRRAKMEDARIWMKLWNIMGQVDQNWLDSIRVKRQAVDFLVDRFQRRERRGIAFEIRIYL